jgi:hypothetical protein
MAKAAAKKNNAKKAGKKGAKNAKDKKATKAPAKVFDPNELHMAPARVKSFINDMIINGGVREEIQKFQADNEKVLKHKKILKIEEDKDAVAEYKQILNFRPGPMPKKVAGGSKEEKDAWFDAQQKKHEKEVSKAVKVDENLAAYKKKYDLHSALTFISGDRKRFSRGSYVVMAVVFEKMLRSILMNAMDEVLDDKKKIVVPGYCVTDSIKNTQFYPLFSNIRTFREMYEKCKPSEDDEEGEEEEEEEEEEEGPRKRGFEFYVEKIGKSITKSGEKRGKYDKIRLSRDLKKFCSNLVIDILYNLGEVLIDLLELKGAKTINDDLVKTAFSVVLKYNGVESTELMAEVEEKVEQVLHHTKSEDGDAADAADADDDADEEEDDDEEEEEEEAPKKTKKGKGRK